MLPFSSFHLPYPVLTTRDMMDVCPSQHPGTALVWPLAQWPEEEIRLIANFIFSSVSRLKRLPTDQPRGLTSLGCV